MTTRRTGSRSGTRARRSGRHSRRKSYKAQWFSVTALAVLGVVMIVHPDAGRQTNLAAQFSGTSLAAEVPKPEPMAAPTVFRRRRQRSPSRCGRHRP